jgi:hypothetical protein
MCEFQVCESLLIFTADFILGWFIENYYKYIINWSSFDRFINTFEFQQSLIWMFILHFLTGILFLNLFLGGSFLFRVHFLLFNFWLNKLWGFILNLLALLILYKKCDLLLLLDKELSFSHILFQKMFHLAGFNYWIERHVQSFFLNGVLFFH